MNSRFSNTVRSLLTVYGTGQHWDDSSKENVTNNVTVLSARFASHLHSHKLEEVFLESYRNSRDYQKLVVMETVAAMVNLTMGNSMSSLRNMRRAASLSRGSNGRNTFYREETERLLERWFEVVRVQ